MQKEKLLNTNKLNIKKINLDKKEIINPVDLITFNRLDLIPKILFLKNLKIDFYKKLYFESIKHLNGFKEDFGLEKNNKEDFYNTFIDTYKSIKERGFLDSESIIPLGKDGIPIDGAHRIAASYVLNKDIVVINTLEESTKYNYNFYKNNGFDTEYLDFLISEYIKIKNKNIFCGILWGKAKGNLDKVKNIINEYDGEVFLVKNLVLTDIGKRNLIINCYKGEPWLGNIKNDFMGAEKKVNMCFSKNDYNIRVIFFEVNKEISSNKLIELKDKIRDIFNIGKNSIHITDTIEETMELSDIFLNKNSINFLNYSLRKNYKKFNLLLKKYKKIIEKNINHYCIVGSSILSFYGIREGNDIDFISDLVDNDFSNKIGNHNKYINKYLNTSILDIIYNPKNYFYTEGNIKVMSIDNFLKFKKNRQENKDMVDINLVNKFFSDNKSWYVSLQIYLLRLRQKIISMFFGFLVSIGKIIIPKKFVPFFKKLYYKIIG